ncbi:dsRBD fold-containing protein [Luteimicrobium sp. DT211]|uniref:dsRBD fold-containing protein n=1 Tax=Luteimicrobium sp. DT211 TaxID=3393412 RepID=UPI003CF12D74
MKASIGDRVITVSGTIGTPAREGRVVELRHLDGSPPFVVEWADTGERSVVFPGPDTVLEHDDGAAPGGGDLSAGDPDEAASAPAPHTTWRVQVDVFEHGGHTHAQALLVAPGEDLASGLDELRSVGQARRAPGDPDMPLVGDELAVGRALRRLANRLLGDAEQDIAHATGDRSHVHA